MALDYFAGCVGGGAGIVVGYPLDTVKVHMQTQDYKNPKYKGSWHCFRTILAKESVAGLYRGISSPMAGVAVVNAVVFGVYGEIQKHIPNPHSLPSHFMAGALAGIAQSPICSPMELAKTRMQLQVSNTPGSGPIQCLRQTYKLEGYRGLFKGLGVTLLRDAPSFGTYFLTYEALTRSSGSAPISTPYMLLAGGMAGSTSWVVSYPLDVIKSRIQADSQRYAGMMDCLRQSVRAEGYSCLYRGLNSTIIRAFPTNAVTFTVVTWTFRLLGEEGSEVSKISSDPGAAESVRDISESHEPFLEKWNTFLTSASDSLMILRVRYSTLPIMSTSHLMLENSALCQTNRWTQMRIKFSASEQGDENTCSGTVKGDVGEEIGGKTVEQADIEQTIAECSFDSPPVVSTSDSLNSS